MDAMTDNSDDKQAKAKELEALKKRNQEALQRVLEQKRHQQQHPPHQTGGARPGGFAPSFSPKPIRRGPRGG
jgi:hypothetical protein